MAGFDRLSGALVALLLWAPAATAGERLWADCRTCHAVTAPDGTVLARGGRSGPDLFGISGRAAAADGDFAFYSPAMRAAAATGLRWSEDNFVAYLANPDQFLRAVTGDPQASAEMHVQMKQGGREIYAYLRSLSQ